MDASDRMQQPTEAEIAYACEWGGRAWRAALREGITAVGDLRGKRVLELGFRSGRVSCLLARLGADVVGVEANPEALPLADAEADRQGVSVRFLVTDGRPESLPPGPFDVVFTKSVLVVAREGTLDAIAQRLAPGGVAVLIENGLGTWLVRALRHWRHRGWDYGYVRFLTERDVSKMGQSVRIRAVRRWHFPPLFLVVGERR